MMAYVALVATDVVNLKAIPQHWQPTLTQQAHAVAAQIPITHPIFSFGAEGQDKGMG